MTMLTVTPTGQRSTLADAVYGEPEQHLVENMGWDRWNITDYKVVTINPKEWYKQAIKGDVTIQEAYRRFAKPWQRKLVKEYRENARELAQTTYLLIDDETLEDGYHRLVAFALAGITEAKAIDMAQEAEPLDQCIHCGCYIETELGADSPGKHSDRTGHYNSPRAPGEYDNICDVCNYANGLKGGPDAVETYKGNCSEWNDKE
jgi:hypothetical protein